MNNDLISRSALKKVFENLASDDYNEPIWYQQTVFETIDNAPTVCNDNYAMGYQDGVKKVLSERPKGEWIPVSERLPEPQEHGDKDFSDWVQISVHVTENFDTVRCAYYCFSESKWYLERFMVGEVTAWQPLPEPYKEADNG